MYTQLAAVNTGLDYPANGIIVAGVVVLGVVWFFSYALSLYWHPLAKCRRCNGGTREEGKLFKRTRRVCTKCSGTGDTPRWGVVLLGKRKAANPGADPRRPKYRPYKWDA